MCEFALIDPQCVLGFFVQLMLLHQPFLVRRLVIWHEEFEALILYFEAGFFHSGTKPQSQLERELI
jgi:hypothetical protein